MKHSSILHISAFIGVSYAQTQGQGFGIGPNVIANAVLLEANQHPNATKSVPFSMGSKNFTLTVNVTELTPAGIDTQVQNPRIINSVAGLGWAGSESLNDTIADEEARHTALQGRPPRLCMQWSLGEVFSRSVTNGYRESDDGDCTHALGKKCVDAIKNSGFDLNVPCDGGVGLVFPKECYSVLPGGSGTGSLLTSNSSADRTNGFGFSFWSSEIYSAGNTTWYERETERLQVFIFSADNAYPVCVRVKTDRVSGDSPASGASRSWGVSAAASIGLVASFTIAWLL